MEDLFQKIQEALSFIRGEYTHRPSIGVILGSGLGTFIRNLELEAEIPYARIPHFPRATVEGHSGNLIFGRLHGKDLAVMAGRFHYYEGYSTQELSFPIRVLRSLGVTYLLISNAAGGLNRQFRVGDLMIITDHINLQPEHPLRGPNDDRLGPRFPDMSQPYNRNLIDKALEISREIGIPLRTGVYAGVQGPTFETRAEYRYLGTIGADAVGMSTVPEVIVGVHAGMTVFALSVITDLGIRELDNIITHEEVLREAKAAEPKLSRIFVELIRTL